MPITMNGQSVGAVFSGGTPISEVYMGGTLVWQNVPKVTITKISDVWTLLRSPEHIVRSNGQYWNSSDKLVQGVPNWNDWAIPEVPFRIVLDPTFTAGQGMFSSHLGDYPAKNKLVTAPEMDTRYLTDMTAFFWNAVNLETIPEYTITACTSIKDFVGNCPKVKSVVLRDCGNVQNVRNAFGAGSETMPACTHVELHGLGPALPAGHVLDLTKTGLDVAGAEALFDSLGTSTQADRPVIALPESAWAVDQRPAIRKGWRVRTYPEVTFSTVEQFGNAVRVNGWPQWYNSTAGWMLYWVGDTRASLPYTLNAQGMTSAFGMFSAHKTGDTKNTALKTVPWFDTRAVTDMQYMFQYCAALTSVPEFDTSAVTTMYGMFQGCAALTQVPELDLTSCTNVGYMLGSGGEGKVPEPTLPTVTLHNMQRVQDCSGMFGDESDNPAPKLKSARMNGLGPGLTNNMKLDMRRTGLTKDGANTLMDSLGTVTSGRTVTLQLPSGAQGCDTSKATSKRWKVTIG